MLPSTNLSSLAITESFRVPLRYKSDIDYELGGIDFKDTTQGLECCLWTSEYDGSTLTISTPDVSYVVITDTGIDHHSFTFDQNMNPCVIFTKGISTYMYWYDPVIGKQTTTLMPVVMEDAQISLDDHRPYFSSNSDIILSYVRDGKLYYRVQRERYLQEHLLHEVTGNKLTQIGMSTNLRFRWRFTSI